MRVYEKSSIIACSQEALFDFHLDSTNLKRITPPSMQVTLLNEATFFVKEGAHLHIEAKDGFLKTLWEVEIEKIEIPSLLVDNALRSPFVYWKHFHIFTNRGDGMCELRDRIEYKLPFGWFGALFDFVVQYKFNGMFTFRHEATKAILENNR